VVANLNRPDWDEIWMSMASLIAKRSIDPQFPVGAVIVTSDNQQVLSLGYNGMEKGGTNELDSHERGQGGAIHAENNALIKLDYNNSKQKKMYVTLSPCKHCCRLIVNANVNEVIYFNDYRDQAGLEILKRAGIKVRKFIVT
jgi:dCMP deaminase